MNNLMQFLLQPFERTFLKFFGKYFLSELEKQFITHNKSLWIKYKIIDHQEPQNNDYILVLPEGHIINSLKNATFAAIACNAKPLKILFLLPRQSSDLNIEVLKSFPHANFVYENSIRYYFSLLFHAFSVLKTFRRIKTPDDLLSLQVDGIPVGDLIYDQVLMEGYATLNSIDKRVLKSLLKFYYYRHIINDLTCKYNISMAVIGHHVGVQGGTYYRYLVNKDTEVFRNAGTGSLMLHKLKSVEDGYLEIFTPEKKYFQKMLKERENLLHLADKCFSDRFNDNTRDLGDLLENLAFKTTKHVFLDRKEFCSAHQLDHNKKNIFVMLHAFNDYPHNYGWIIYKDFYEWFIETLKIAELNKNVNWIFKEHPYSKYYRTKDLDINDLFKKVTLDHILFLNSEANFNAKSLLSLSDAVVTCIGTAGMEYSAAGIPCVLAGRSAYSGFGFTYEPQTEEEYKDILMNIQSLQKINGDQIQRAKLIMLYEFKIAYDSPDPFFPNYGFEQLYTVTVDSFLADILKHRSETKSEQYEIMEDLIKFVRDPKLSLYVNTKKYGFLNE